MLLDPLILALLVSSAAVAACAGGAAAVGAGIVRSWDRASGSPLQIALERRTVLVGALVRMALAVEIVSLFFLVFAAERLHVRFAGAMCAAGVFAASPWGYPLLLLRALGAASGGLWLVIDRLDRAGWDYPLLRVKLLALMPLSLLLAADTALLLLFFSGLRPDVLTSCCGVIFDQARGSGGIVTLPFLPAVTGFFSLSFAAIAAGCASLIRPRWTGAFALLSALSLPVSLLAVISFVAPCAYRLPSHHCPFCLLQPSASWLGLALYPALFLGATAGMAAGLVHLFRSRDSLREEAPRLRRRLTLAALAGSGLFTLIAAALLVLALAAGFAP